MLRYVRNQKKIKIFFKKKLFSIIIELNLRDYFKFSRYDFLFNLNLKLNHIRVANFSIIHSIHNCIFG